MMIQRTVNTSSRQARSTHRRSTRQAFTLVEILVALAVMMLMLTIILVPINMGLSVFHIGKARAEVQQANQLVLNQLASELKGAIHVFPNEELPGITNRAPYSANANKPYYDTSTSTEVSNTARLDFLLPAVNAVSGSILTPPRSNNYVVTYYARRLDPAKAYDVFTNPIVLWRAQYAYRNDDPASTNTADLVNLGTDRYSPSVAPWLTQIKGEPNLVSYGDINNAAIALASHTLITPRDMALVSPTSVSKPGQTMAELIVSDPTNVEASYQPDSSFVCDDVNGDGKIDRVTMSLLLQKYDSLGADDDKSQQIRATQTVALPNIK